MKKLFKNDRSLKVIVLTLVVALVALGGVSMSVFADQNSKKENPNDGTKSTSESVSNDETVYVLTHANGSEKQRIVSEDGTLHYEGYEDCTLPVTTKISYTLDGKSVTAKELAGKSGHVTITINYTNNIKSGGVYVPFMAVTGMVLDNDTFSNVKVTNGKTLDDGNRNLVVGYAFPGMQQSLGISKSDFDIPETVTVSADVEKYQMEILYTLVTNEVFNDADFSSVENVGDLKSSLSKLSGAADKLVSGTEELYKSTAKLQKYADALSKGANSIKENSYSLYQGSKKLSGYNKQLVTGLDTISANSASLNAGAKQIMDSSVKTADASLGDLRTAFKQMGKDIPTLTSDNYATVIDEVINTLKAVDAQKGTNDYATVIATLQGAKTQLDSISQFYNGVVQYTAGVDQASASAKKISEGSASLTTNMKAFYDGTTEFSKKQASFADGMNQLKAGSKELNEGVDKFAKEGMGKLDKLSKSDLGDILSNVKSLGNAAKAYKGFGSKGNYDSVKFIYKADEVSAE